MAIPFIIGGAVLIAIIGASCSSEDEKKKDEERKKINREEERIKSYSEHIARERDIEKDQKVKAAKSAVDVFVKKWELECSHHDVKNLKKIISSDHKKCQKLIGSLMKCSAKYKKINHNWLNSVEKIQEMEKFIDILYNKSNFSNIEYRQDHTILATGISTFIDKIFQFESTFKVLEGKGENLLKLRDDLKSSLDEKAKITSSKIKKNNNISKISDSLKNVLRKSFVEWTSTWDEQNAMRDLSEKYENRIIFLVFGKVNSGKSTFCNYVAELFPDGIVKRFQVIDGKIVYNNNTFAEGITETTAAIQGIEFGEKLVLLDSPGLHSCTQINHDLTKRFTDSADAVLWVTSSKSPGQLQELDELKYEIEKKKPLQPVITGSDKIEEDYNESTDEIVKILHNKPPEIRKAQEKDVFERACQNLEKDFPLKMPVSISVHVYKKSERSLDDEKDCGLALLMEKLTLLVDEAAEYKLGKARQQVINYLDREVLDNLKAKVLPEARKLKQATEEQIASLESQREMIVLSAMSEIDAAIYPLANRHKDSKNTKAFAEELNSFIEKTIQEKISTQLQPFMEITEKVVSDLSPETLGEFEVVKTDIEQVSGSGYKGAGAGLGAATGASIGTMIMPGIGTIIGGILGGFLGEKAGEFFVKTETVSIEVGVSTEKLVNNATANVKKKLPDIINKIVTDIKDEILKVESFARAIESALLEFESEVVKLKEA